MGTKVNNDEYNRRAPHNSTYVKDKKVVHLGNEDGFKLSDFRSLALFLALVLSNFIAAVDETIVSTAMGAIVKDFQSLNQVTWIAVSYLLTVTAMQPIYGKLSDVFGSKWVLIVAIVLFALGSVLCGASSNIIMFIIFRAFSGIGGGGLITMPAIIISELVPIHRRGFYVGFLESSFALSQLLGPVIGGTFSDYLSWRWAFYVNVPICAFCLITAIFSMGKRKSKVDEEKTFGNEIVVTKVDAGKSRISWMHKLKRIDYGGAIVLMLATTCLVLGTHLGGRDYAWVSAPVLSTLILTVVFTILFFVIEFKWANEPIAPYHIFNRNTILLNLISIVFGGILYIALYYFPLYFQVVEAKSSMQAGVEMLPFLLGSVVLLLLSGVLIHKTGYYRWLLILGTGIMSVGIGLMILVRVTITKAEMVIYTLLVGVGIGFCIVSAIIASQAAVDPKDNGVITALATFSLSLGGIIGLVLSGTVFENTLASQVQEISGVDASKVLSSSEYIRSLAPELANLVQSAYIHSFQYLYIASTAFAILGFAASLGLKHIPIDQ